MNKKRSKGALPEEVLGLLGTLFIVPAIIAIIAILSGALLPVIGFLRRTEVTRLFWAGLAAGVFGIIFLFFARLPLYRQRRFLTWGPRALTGFHRRLYWLAYWMVLVSVGLLVFVGFRLK